MKMTSAMLLTASAFGGAIALAVPARAADFSFVGSFAQDDSVQLFDFVVGATSNVTLRTWSYAGGVNAAGATIARGGFDPILALFDSSGALINQNDDGGCGLVAADLTGACWDTFLSASLGAGTYTVSVMQFDNFAIGPNLANGFVRSGQGNFTPGLSNCAAGQNQFEDVSGSADCGRDGHWAFDILNVNAAETRDGGVPEPATWMMLLLGFGAIGFGMRNRKKRQNMAVSYS